MDVFTNMDLESAALVLQLQIEESQELFEALEGKGKNREGELSDSQVALQLYKEDLERNVAMLSDRKMSRSIVDACELDGEVLIATLSEEHAAAGDREIACGLGGVASHCSLPPWTVGSEFLDDEVMEKLRALWVTAPVDATSSGGEFDCLSDGETDSDDGVPESSTWAAMRKSPKHQKRVCTACHEQVIVFELARAPCGHEYCRDCLRDLFRASFADASLFPPRCCRQTITTGSSIRIYLTGDLVQEYEQKKIEFDTPDKTYCSNPLCSAFILMEHVTDEHAACPRCLTLTCTICKAGTHGGDCPKDVSLQQVLAAAREHGWQRCYNCHRLVELDVGCNHMTCHCSAQFCYICGERWKTCTCAQWDENRLLERANQVIARQPARVDAPQQQARIDAVVQNLRDRHNCDHETWQYVRGRYQCEECRDTLPAYIFECRQCNIQACNRCRRNRL